MILPGRGGGGRINPYISVTIVLKMYNMYVNFSVQSANIKKKLHVTNLTKKNEDARMHILYSVCTCAWICVESGALAR